ncbi:OLC1v1039189C1 [Oldenlandia corymbosa var. corymbosa]|uniref:OLC1v1039189C1 n=1 Tax=Oldenlandia corymbosa var. corymbosa TaxID=529605 RepID=A0AAV1D2M2_OLDCO|nr:OLC1v1039189C1 [Oldenlandia corymbosa var. corymbosa]
MAQAQYPNEKGPVPMETGLVNAIYRIGYELRCMNISVYKLARASQLFLPVLHSAHYYLYVFNMVNKRVEVIDNADSIGASIPFKNKYGETYMFMVRY